VEDHHAAEDEPVLRVRILLHVFENLEPGRDDEEVKREAREEHRRGRDREPVLRDRAYRVHLPVDELRGAGAGRGEGADGRQRRRRIIGAGEKKSIRGDGDGDGAAAIDDDGARTFSALNVAPATAASHDFHAS
jgi:hypothetical protein